MCAWRTFHYITAVLKVLICDIPLDSCEPYKKAMCARKATERIEAAISEAAKH